MACIASSFAGSVAALKATKVQVKKISTVVKADIYPEFGTYRRRRRPQGDQGPGALRPSPRNVSLTLPVFAVPKKIM
eukprot:CAMPEP_0181363232 /NCGR_PEP_ID=MMETSP1106-20121128/8580_1 /TAXON_ID=81844 /ORGANISM="Mantoniella antarctica, Strain SL-175" /LENGTH=76 /DNA_ID=CAMNT_0023477539 /DNA_START=53 /DNA_END=283 /DNA_ORIENTATION=+